VAASLGAEEILPALPEVKSTDVAATILVPVESISAMEKRGLKVSTLSPQADAEWNTAAQAVYPKIRGTIVPADMFDEVMSQLKTYRETHQGTKK